MSSARLRYLEYGKSIIAAEAEALSALHKNLGESFEHAVDTILSLHPQGRVIVSGMGKAGIIGKKISATLASIGVPSFSLHPSEAIHGDLGRFTKADLALVLSNSGETPEILGMIPHLKRIPCPIIAITRSSDTALGRNSDIVLELGKISEAGPHGLAPTTSAISMLALGDAMAMTLSHAKGISKEDFAAFHPGGDLGRSLMIIRDVMRKGEMICVASEELLTKEVLHRITITPGRPGAAALVNKDGKLTGIFTDGDLRRCLEHSSGFLEKPIKTVMGTSPKTIQESEFVISALEQLSHFKIDQILVVDSSSRPVGLVDIQDLVQLRLVSA